MKPTPSLTAILRQIPTADLRALADALTADTNAVRSTIAAEIRCRGWYGGYQPIAGKHKGEPNPPPREP